MSCVFVNPACSVEGRYCPFGSSRGGIGSGSWRDHMCQRRPPPNSAPPSRAAPPGASGWTGRGAEGVRGGALCDYFFRLLCPCGTGQNSSSYRLRQRCLICGCQTIFLLHGSQCTESSEATIAPFTAQSYQPLILHHLHARSRASLWYNTVSVCAAASASRGAYRLRPVVPYRGQTGD